MSADRRGRYAAAMSSQANLDAVLRLADAETARLRAELDHRDPDALVSVRRVREWLDGGGAVSDGADLSGLRLPLHRTEAGWPSCSTCDGGGCPDCTDPA